MSDLPGLVRRYADRNVESEQQQSRRHVRLTKVREMQLKPGRWLSFRAAQELAVARVEFAWRANFRVAPFVSLRVRD